MKTNIKLSNNASILLNAIKQQSLWEDKAIDVLFPPITYSKDTAAQVWQREANLYSYIVNRPVNGVNIDFYPNVNKSYSDITYEAIRELLAAKLIYSHNAGYNTYSYNLL